MENIKIEKGDIMVDDHTITILDDAKKQNRLLLISSISWTIYGVISLYRYATEGDEFLLWTGLLIGIAHFFIAFQLIFITSNASIIRKDTIASVKKKSRFGNEFIALKLKNRRVRKITHLSGNVDEIMKVIS